MPVGDRRRVEALRDLEILDTVDEARFEKLIRNLAETLDAPIAYLALIDAERQWLKASVGPLEKEVSREHAFCSHTIMGTEPLVVADASEDPRFASSPLVTRDPELRFYAGVPIADRASGETIGTVCIADQARRELTARELAVLEGFAERVADEVNARPTAVVAYSASDLDWVERLIAQGEELARQRVFDLWSDLRVASGDDRDWKLERALQRSRSVILLLTEAFLSSDFIRRDAFRRRLEEREREGAEVLPVLLEPCGWAEIDWLAKRSPLTPNGGEAATTLQVDALFSELAARIEARSIQRERAPTADQDVPAGLRQETLCEAPKLFLSHASEDAEAVRELAKNLRRAGLNVWLDIDELKPGDSWMEELEGALRTADAFAVYVGRVGVERWIGREVRVALDRNVEDPQFRVIPILGPGADPEALPGFLAQHHWLDLRTEGSDPTRIKELLGAILDRPAEVVSLLAPGETPFRGLLPFDRDHAHLFYGRDCEIEELGARVVATPFLAVIGESGSGKSSLVRAGLVPALHRGRGGEGPGGWRTLIMRPGGDPFRELTNALPDLAPGGHAADRMSVRERCADCLAEGTAGLRDCVGGLVPAGQRTLLVVDQFEELFTMVFDIAERHRFIDTLLTASDTSGDRPVHAVITLRADFFSHCFEHPKLPGILSESQFPLRAIADQQLAEVIEKPAAMAGVALEPGLVEAILHDVGQEAASLALLEHTLLELWKLRSGETLTHESYKSIGRVQGALEHHAEDVFDKLDPEQQACAKRVMLNLAVPGGSDRVARRQLPLDKLLPAGERGGPTEWVVEHLVEQRLLTVRRGAESGDGADEIVEVAHEALLRGWQRLRGWLEDDRDFQLWKQRARTSYDAWEESERDDGALLRGGPLEEAERWLNARAADILEDGRAFITASLAQREREARQEESHRQRLRRRAIFAAAFGMVAAVFGTVAIVFWLGARAQRAEAENNLEVATMALRRVGTVAELSGRTEAEPPEVVELKRGIAEQALEIYEQARGRPSFPAGLQLEEAVARYRLGNVLAVESRPEESAAAHAEAIRILEQLRSQEPGNERYRQQLGNALYWSGERERRAGSPEAAEAEYLKALDLQQELATARSSEIERQVRLFELGRTANGLGIALRRQDRLPEAEQRYTEARTSFEQATADLPPTAESEVRNRYHQGRAWALTNLAELYEARADDFLDRAERYEGRAARHRDRAEVARAEELVVKAAREFQGAEREFARAEALYREAIGVLEALEHAGRELEFELAQNYSNLGGVYTNLAYVRAEQNRLEEAEIADRAALDANLEAVELMRKLAVPLAGIQDELGKVYINRGEAYLGAGSEAEARASYREAHSVFLELSKAAGEAAPYKLRLAHVLAGLSQLGDGEASEELCALLPELRESERKRFRKECP